MKEHLVAAGECIVDFLFLILSWINMIEYIPMNFRRGTQVPLYKGKNTSPLDPNNYRGITLLTTFNKIFEILLWSRIEKWWVENNAVAETQGACKKGVSSVHTAMLLQETVTSNLENGHLVFVDYLDVSKAFDRVWVEGLFYQLRKIGIKGKTWRLLFKCYKGFLCRVRLHGKYSNWYEMKCGIHQGGYLSLVKYTAFINSLLTILKASDLCCNILHFKTSPLGYADDIAAACTSKHKIDQVLNIVNTHSSKWRYDLNAKKSAVMVYGEESTINKRNMGYRNYRLGSESVPEKTSYDHVGIKTCNGQNYNIRTEEKIGKACRALSAASSLGIKKGGISMRACNIIFWCLIVPILTYGSELWVLKQSDIDELDKFQRYAGRRFQRFPKWSPNETSCKGLGWMRLETYIYAKKLVFIRTILVRDDECIYKKKVFKQRAIQFNSDIEKYSANIYDSPIFNMLRIAIIFDFYHIVMSIVTNEHFYSKLQWKTLIWNRAWQIEDSDWQYGTMFYKAMENINMTIGSAKYLTWWHISDVYPKLMKECETLAKIVCNASDLKCDHYKYKGASFYSKSCSHCDQAAYENAEHMIMSCPYNRDYRDLMYEELSNNNECKELWNLLPKPSMLKVILGGKTGNSDFSIFVPIWCIVAKWVHKMYFRIVNERSGVG